MAIERLFTTGSLRPEDMIRTKTAPTLDSEQGSLIDVPENWSLEAADAFRAALCQNVPTTTQMIEENTVPSWLWRHRPATQATSRAETSATDVFNRIAGAAAYRGWKAGLWDDEIEASVFYDEARAALFTRRLSFAPAAMAKMGLDWAYGMPAMLTASSPQHQRDILVLQNESIDNILSQSQPITRNKWNRFCETTRSNTQSTIAFADTLTEWGTLPEPASAPRIQINLQAFRHADGSVDTEGLQQTARLAVILSEMHEDIWRWQDERPLAIGFANLASLLMSLAIPYDSEQARTTAASLAAILSGTAIVTSAMLAERLGVAAKFSERREHILRALRNRLRASFGEANDYEKLSVIPQTITLESGADLVLISAARHACEQALRAVEQKGLRHLQLTSLFTSSDFAALLEASSQGTEAENALVTEYALEDGTFIRRAHPAITKGMLLRGYDESDCQAVQEHLVGTRTLIAAPGINQTYLKEKGFDQATLDRLEENLKQVSSLKQLFTPWTLGMDFYQNNLKIPAQKLKAIHFDLLRHLGFTPREIKAASIFCCGHRNVSNCLDLAQEDRDIFIDREDLSPESQIRMAAAIQPFIDGETNLTLAIPASVVAQVRGELVLMAWKMGVKNMTLALDGLPPSHRPVDRLMKRTTKSARTKQQLPFLPNKKSRLGRKKATTLESSLPLRKHVIGEQN